MKLLGKKVYRIGLKPYKNGFGSEGYSTASDAGLSGNSSCCVHPETQISMADGTTKNAKDILIGDKLQTQAGIGTVEIVTNPTLGLRQLFSYGRGSYFITGDHPIHTSEGWKSLAPKYSKLDYDTDCELLKLGDVLTLINGDSYKLEKIEGENNNSDLVLYDFHMDGNEDANHTYFANGLLVHNGGGGGGGGGSGGCGNKYANEIDPGGYYGSGAGSIDAGQGNYSGGSDNDQTAGWGGGDTLGGEAPNVSAEVDDSGQGWGGGDTGEGGSRPESSDDTMGWGGGDTGQGSAPPESITPVGTGEETGFGGDDPSGDYYGSFEGALGENEDWGENPVIGGGAMGIGEGETFTGELGDEVPEGMKVVYDPQYGTEQLVPIETPDTSTDIQSTSQIAYDKEGRAPGDPGYDPGDTTVAVNVEVQQNYNDEQAALHDPDGKYPDRDYWSELSDKDRTDYTNKTQKTTAMKGRYADYLAKGGDPSLSADDFTKKYDKGLKSGFWQRIQKWAKKLPGKAARALPPMILTMMIGPLGAITTIASLIAFGQKLNDKSDKTIVDKYNEAMDEFQKYVDDDIDKQFPDMDPPNHDQVMEDINSGTGQPGNTPPPDAGGGNGNGNNTVPFIDKLGESEAGDPDDENLEAGDPVDEEPGAGEPGDGEPGAGTPEGGTMPPKTSDELYDEYIEKLRAQAFGESPSLSAAAMKREREEGLKERMAMMASGRGQPSAAGLRQYDRAKGTADRELAAGAAEVSLKEQQAMMGEYGKQLSDQKERDRRERASQDAGKLKKELKNMDINEKIREGWTRTGLSLLKGAWSRYGNKVDKWVKAGWDKLTAEDAINEISLDPDYFWESQAVNLDDSFAYKPESDQWYIDNMPSPDSNGGIDIDLNSEVESQGDWEVTPGGDWTWVWNWQWSPTSSTPETAGALVDGEWVDMFVQNQVGQLIPNTMDLGDEFFDSLFPGMTVFPDADDGGFNLFDPDTWFAEGGSVDGPGTETSDDIPALLSDGEFVIKASAVKGLGRSKGAKTDEEARDKGIELLYELQNKYGDLEEYSDGGAAFGDVLAERRLLDRNRVRGGRNV